MGLDVLETTHHLAASVGRTTGRGVEKPHFLEGIWREYQGNLRERIDPLYIATRWVKHSVMHRPFRDANRRTAFLWAAIHFRMFGFAVRVDTQEAIRFKESVKNATFAEVQDWWRERLTPTLP